MKERLKKLKKCKFDKFDKFDFITLKGNKIISEIFFQIIYDFYLSSLSKFSGFSMFESSKSFQI